jgi:hypothetical protein
MFSMKHLLMGVYQVCSNKSPWVKIGPGGLYTGERPQGHHGPLVLDWFQIFLFKNFFLILFIKMENAPTRTRFQRCSHSDPDIIIQILKAHFCVHPIVPCDLLMDIIIGSKLNQFKVKIHIKSMFYKPYTLVLFLQFDLV